MTILLFTMLALTRVGQSMGIVAFPDNKEVVLGIMANICPMLGEFNTPLGPEGNLRSVIIPTPTYIFQIYHVHTYSWGAGQGWRGHQCPRVINRPNLGSSAPGDLSYLAPTQVTKKR